MCVLTTHVTTFVLQMKGWYDLWLTMTCRMIVSIIKILDLDMDCNLIRSIYDLSFSQLQNCF